MRLKLATAICLLLLPLAAARAASVDSLESKVDSAQGEAGELADQLRVAQGELASAQTEAAAASAHEEELTGLLAVGEERSAQLRGKVEGARHELAVARKRLGRARGVLADRLVAIYESGSPSEAAVVLSAADFDDLTTRAGYLEQVESSDAALARRVGEVRDEVRGGLERVSDLKEQADAYNDRLVAARSEVSTVRGDAEAASARLQSLTAARAASLSDLKSRIGGWVSEIETAEAASHEAAEETVGRWLGGPYSIPAYIVMCESGGDYGIVNSSSGAGGAYQILPSTWELYGGQGEPQDASKAEQDRIASEIWADSGSSAWVCG